MYGKTLTQSKTIVFGLLQLVLSLIATLQSDEFIKQFPRAIGVLGIISSVVVILLRIITNTPILFQHDLKDDENKSIHEPPKT